eukprot:sb/3474939/
MRYNYIFKVFLHTRLKQLKGLETAEREGMRNISDITKQVYYTVGPRFTGRVGGRVLPVKIGSGKLGSDGIIIIRYYSSHCYQQYPLFQEPTETSKQPIRTRYLGHVTSYQPIRDQYFLIRSVPASNIIATR